MKKILIFSLAAMLGLVTCTERPEQIIDPAYTRLFSPTNVEAEVQAVVNATIKWKEVQYAQGYVLELFNNPDLAGAALRIDETEATTFRYENLPEDVEYGVRVKAVSDELPESKWTIATFKTTPPPPPETIEWNFSDEEFAGITDVDFKETLTVRGLDVVGGTGGVRRTTNAVTIDDYSFTHRLDLRGGGTWNTDLAQANRVIHFKAEKPCVVTVYANSSSAGRTLKITDKNNAVLGEYGTTGTPGKVDMNVTEATDIYIYSAGSGIEVYLVKMIIGGSYEPDHTATLKGLAVTGETLSPAFDSEETAYEVNVAKSVERITITATKNHVKQTIEGDGEQALTGSSTAFPVKVTAEDGTTSKTYNITVKREATASSDATLKTLTVSPGDLSPGFDPNVTEYSVATTAEKVAITAAVNHKFAKVGDNGVFEADNLVVGVPRSVIIPVLAEDLTTKIYIVTVTRQAPSGGGDTPGTIVNGFYVPTDGEEFRTISANIAAMEWVTDTVGSYSERTKCYSGNVPTLSAATRTVAFKVKGVSSFTVQADGNGSRNLMYTINGGTPITSKTFINGCDTEDVSTGNSGECTIEIAGNNGSVYLHGMKFHK
jgi:hypothetical protein